MPPKRKRAWGYAKRSAKRRRAFRTYRRTRRLSRFRRRPRRFRMSMRRRFSRVLPNKVFCRHKYVSEWSASPSTTVTTHLTNTNNMFDPNETGAGHQPYLRDEMAVLYSYVEVVYCTIKSTMLPNPSNTEPVYVGQLVANANDSVPAGGAIDAWKEHPRSNFKLVPVQSYSDRKYSLYKKTSNRKWVKDKENNEVAVGQDPAERVVHVLWMASYDSTTTCTVEVSQVITYYAIWSRPKLNQAAS